jgi:hypothetical protein
MSFIESAGTQQGLPPFSFPGLSITSFVLQADLVRLQDYCDLLLNIAPEHHFRPLGSHVCLAINQYPKMYSKYPGRDDLGYSSQNEYYFMFPVVRYDLFRGNFMLPREITWVFPFIGVDNSTSALIGRELLGFQKLLGVISAETAADGRFLASVAMPALKSPSGETPEEELPLITIRTGTPLNAREAPPQGFPWNLVGVAAEARVVDDLALALFDLVDPGAFSVTNLKQFRDGPNPQAAAYQALVRCEWRQENATLPTVYEGAEIEVYDNATIQIVETLGLSQGTGSRLAAIEATSLTTDMWFGNVTNVFVAS